AAHRLSRQRSIYQRCLAPGQNVVTGRNLYNHCSLGRRKLSFCDVVGSKLTVAPVQVGIKSTPRRLESSFPHRPSRRLGLDEVETQSNRPSTTWSGIAIERASVGTAGAGLGGRRLADDGNWTRV